MGWRQVCCSSKCAISTILRPEWDTRFHKSSWRLEEEDHSVRIHIWHCKKEVVVTKKDNAWWRQGATLLKHLDILHLNNWLWSPSYSTTTASSAIFQMSRKLFCFVWLGKFSQNQAWEKRNKVNIPISGWTIQRLDWPTFCRQSSSFSVPFQVQVWRSHKTRPVYNSKKQGGTLIISVATL